MSVVSSGDPSGVNLYTRGGDDIVTVDVGGPASSPIANPLTYDGGLNFDALIVTGAPGAAAVDPFDTVTYTPGPAVDQGRLAYVDGGVTEMLIDFRNLEPVLDLVPSASLIVNGNHANNAINYSGSVIGLAAGNLLVRVNPAAPGTVQQSLAVTGLAAGETLRGIDFQPGTSAGFPKGTLFGVATNAAVTTAQVYAINPFTGVATPIGAAFAITAGATGFGIDFNPTNLLLRITSDANDNFSFNPLTGVATAQTALTAGADVVASAYDRNDENGGTPTTLFGIDFTTDTLIRQGSVDGAPSGPGTGIITTIGPLGFDTSAAVSFDIVGEDQAIATLTVNGVAGLYSIDLTTGAATFLGATGTPLLGLAAASFVGLVSVDSFETIEFANKANLTINANAGSDTVNLNNPFTPDGLTSINVNGGDPTAGSDTVIVNGTVGANTITVNSFTADGAVVTGASPSRSPSPRPSI